MQCTSSKTNGVYTIIQCLILMILSAWIYQQNQPTPLVTPALSNAKLQCVSYAPYYGKDQSPLVLGTMISHAQIDADLKKLAEITQCIRTYSVGQGMDYVPEAAQKVGLKVYLGAWIGWVNQDNEKEVSLAAKIAKNFPDTVKALIIGNEVFLRGEQKEAAMQRYISMARKQTNTPITYADVWEFWNKHRAMEAHVDFITVHILPYWEDNPVKIDQAVMHASNVMAQLGDTFAKPILIGETGWPSVGRQRDASVPSVINQARYVREFLKTAEEKNWQYNIIEAIDQPWKRNLEGTVGGFWGLLSTDLNLKFSLTAPVSARNDGIKPLYFALIGATIFLGLSLLKNVPSKTLRVALCLLGASCGLVALLQYAYLMAACRDSIEWTALGGVALLGWLSLALQPLSYFTRENLQSIQKNQHLIACCLTGLLIASIVSSSLILIDGRYRDFPNLLFVLPAIIYALNTLFKNCPVCISTFISARFMQVLCFLSSIIALLCYWKEPTNQAAIFWLIINLLLAYACWPKRQHPAT